MNKTSYRFTLAVALRAGHNVAASGLVFVSQSLLCQYSETILVYLVGLQQSQPLHAQVGRQPHSGAHLQAPWALGRQAQAALLQLEQEH